MSLLFVSMLFGFVRYDLGFSEGKGKIFLLLLLLLATPTYNLEFGLYLFYLSVSASTGEFPIEVVDPPSCDFLLLLSFKNILISVAGDYYYV